MTSKTTSSGCRCQRRARRRGTACCACFQTWGVRKYPRHSKKDCGPAAAGGAPEVDRAIGRSSATGRRLVTATMMAENVRFSCASLPTQLRHPGTVTVRRTNDYDATNRATVNDIANNGYAVPQAL